MAAAVEGAAPLPEAAQPGEAEAYDSRFEFDAPRFYDFAQGSPASDGSTPPDHWFETSATKGLVTPTKGDAHKEVVQAAAQAQQTADAAAAEARSQPAEPLSKAGAGGRAALAPLTNKALPAGGQPAAGGAGAKAVARSKGPSAGTRSATKQPRKRPADAEAPAPQVAKPGSSKPAPAKQQAQQHAAAHSPKAGHNSSEELEMERVERGKEEAARLRRHNAAAVKAVLQQPAPPPPHSSKPLTQPVGLELRTSKRQRVHGMETRSMGGGEDIPWRSLAEQMANYDYRAPALQGRGGAAGAGGAAAGAARPQHGQNIALTLPKSPRFATARRSRPARFKPREVEEQEMMAAMPKFKARPAPKGILQPGPSDAGVAKVAPKPVTEPHPFHLVTDERAAAHGGSMAAGGPFVFKAQAAAPDARVTRTRAKQWGGGFTLPHPFHFATDSRAGVKRSAAEPEEQQPEARHSKRVRKLAGPPQLQTDVRGEHEQARLERLRAEQQDAARREANFKARPLNKAVLAAPLPVAPSTCQLTVPVGMPLKSDARAAQRQQFDAGVASRQQEQEAQREQEEQETRQREEVELQEYRQDLQPKANPLPDYYGRQ